LYLWSWSESAWILQDTRTVGSQERLVSIGPLSPSPYVSATGEMRLRVLGAGTTSNFNAVADLVRFTIESAGSAP
jgi:hypothetical protein